MSRGKKITVTVAVFVLVLGGVGAYVAHRELVGTQAYDSDLYARAAGTTQAAPFSDEDYAAVLKAHVDDKGMVDYKALKEDHGKLDDFLVAMARLDGATYDAWTEQARIAFWINAYNALTLKAILDHYPIQAGLLSGLAYPKNSIRQIPGVWDKLQFLVVGSKMTLNQIEHETLRAKFNEPRIHVALVCAALGCPRLRNEPFVGEKLGDQLDDQTKGFVNDPAKFRIDRDGGKVYLSSIFKWFGGDFVKKHKPEAGFDSGGSDAEKAVLHFASGYLPAQDAEYLRTGRYAVAYLDYDWSLNEQK
jgi:hypothetical protein